MSTPTGRREDEPIDGPVRQLFWRLRARLVTPPQEQRAQADLDRLLSLAQERAHVAPSAGATASPLLQHDEDTAPDYPLISLTGDGSGIGHLVEVVPIRGRFHGLHNVGRVAAAAMVLFAFGAGVSTARDGSVTLDALLGRTPAESGQDLPTALPAPDLAPAPADGDLPEAADPEPEPDEPSDVAAPDDVEAEAPVPPAPAEPESGSDEAQDPEPAAPSEQPRDTAPAPDTGSSPKPGRTTPTPDPEVDDEPVMAAPDPEDDVIGAGGGAEGCDDRPLVECIAPEEPTDEGGPTTPDEPTDDADAPAPEDDEPATDHPADPADELKDRRFSGN